MKKPEQNTNTRTSNQTPATITSFDVSRVKMRSNNKVYFSLTLNDVTINGCTVIEHANGDFISYPCYKGNDGKFYNFAYVRLSDEDQKKIIAELERQLNN